jgi:hypothetical protein
MQDVNDGLNLELTNALRTPLRIEQAAQTNFKLDKTSKALFSKAT